MQIICKVYYKYTQSSRSGGLCGILPSEKAFDSNSLMSFSLSSSIVEKFLSDAVAVALGVTVLVAEDVALDRKLI